jgi:hypothetical protein
VARPTERGSIKSGQLPYWSSIIRAARKSPTRFRLSTDHVAYTAPPSGQAFGRPPSERTTKRCPIERIFDEFAVAKPLLSFSALASTDGRVYNGLGGLHYVARIDDRARRWLIPGSDPTTPTVSSCREMDAGTCRWCAETKGSGMVWRLDGVDQLDIALAMSRDCWALRRLSTRSQDLSLSLSLSGFRYRLG